MIPKYDCQGKIIENVGPNGRVFETQCKKDKTPRRRVGDGGRKE